MSSTKRALTDFGTLQDMTRRLVAKERADSGWAQFNDLEKHYAATEAMGIRTRPAELDFEETLALPIATATTASAGNDGLTLDQVLTRLRNRNRVCPRGQAWQVLYDLLRRHSPNTADLSGPLLDTKEKRHTALDKRMRLRQQIEWADREGCLRSAYAYLSLLPDADWLFIASH